MRALYIYNPLSSVEVSMIERVKQEIGNVVIEVKVAEVNDVRDIYPIRATPALILLRDDLQGGNLLDEADGQLRVTGEVYKALEEEENNIHNMQTYRIDSLINAEKTKAIDEYTLELIDGGII